MAAFVLPLLAGLGGLGMNIWGGIRSKQANEKADQQLAQRQQDLDSWYKKRYYTPYLNTEEGQSYLSQLREMLMDQSDVNKQSAVRTGATAESRVAAGGELQKQAGRAISQLAGLGTQDKRGVEGMYMQLKNLLGDQAYQNLLSKNQNWMNFLGNTNSAMGNIFMASAMGGGNGQGGGMGDWLRKLFGGNSVASPKDISQAMAGFGQGRTGVGMF